MRAWLCARSGARYAGEICGRLRMTVRMQWPCSRAQAEKSWRRNLLSIVMEVVVFKNTTIRIIIWHMKSFRPPTAAHLPSAQNPLGEHAPLPSSVLERLVAANLRPTVARIGLYQAVAATAAQGLTAHDAFQAMCQRGVPVSLSSVSRILRELCGQGLFSMTFNRNGAAVFFVHGDTPAQREIRFECARTDHCAVVVDDKLHALLLHTAKEAGLELGGQSLVVRG